MEDFKIPLDIFGLLICEGDHFEIYLKRGVLKT